MLVINLRAFAIGIVTSDKRNDETGRHDVGAFVVFGRAVKFIIHCHFRTIEIPSARVSRDALAVDNRLLIVFGVVAENQRSDRIAKSRNNFVGFDSLENCLMKFPAVAEIERDATASSGL